MVFGEQLFWGSMKTTSEGNTSLNDFKHYIKYYPVSSHDKTVVWMIYYEILSTYQLRFQFIYDAFGGGRA